MVPEDRVLKFLTEKTGHIREITSSTKNPTCGKKKLQIDGPPLVLVFNRKGELVKKIVDKDVDYAELKS